MRMTLASALALCGAILLSIQLQASPKQEQAAAATGQAASTKPAININTATSEQLEALPGIGQKTAQLIIEFRTKNGGFKRIEDLMNVKGIGEKSFLKLKPLIVVPKTEKAPGD